MLGIDGGESELIESKGVKGMVVLHATGETMVAQLTQVVLEEEQIACVEKLVGVEHVGHEIAGVQTGEAAREAFGASDEVVISDVGGDATSRSGNSRGGSACPRLSGCSGCSAAVAPVESSEYAAECCATPSGSSRRCDSGSQAGCR